jgi:hypothetical protein
MSPIRAAVLLAATLLAAGCQTGSGNSVGSRGSSSSPGSTSSSVSCTNGECRIAVSGDPSGARVGVLGRGLRIETIEEGAVTVSVDGDSARIPAGATQTVGGLSVRVVSATGGEARLEARRV